MKRDPFATLKPMERAVVLAVLVVLGAIALAGVSLGIFGGDSPIATLLRALFFLGVGVAIFMVQRHVSRILRAPDRDREEQREQMRRVLAREVDTDDRDDTR